MTNKGGKGKVKKDKVQQSNYIQSVLAKPNQADPKIQEKIETVMSFTSWKNKEDIARVLEDSGYDVEKAVENIIEGISRPTALEDWTVVQRKEKKEKNEGTSKPVKDRSGNNYRKPKDSRSRNNQPPRQQQTTTQNTQKESQGESVTPIQPTVQNPPETTQSTQTKPQTQTENLLDNKQVYMRNSTEDHTKTFLQVAQDSVIEHKPPAETAKQDPQVRQEQDISQRSNTRNRKNNTNVPNTTVENQAIRANAAAPISPPKQQVPQVQQQQNLSQGTSYSYRQNYSKQAWKPKESSQSIPQSQPSSIPSQPKISATNIAHSEIQNKPTSSGIPSGSTQPAPREPPSEKIVQTSESSVNASSSVILPSKSGLDFQNQFPQFNFGSLTITDYDGSYNPSDLIALQQQQQAKNAQARYMEQPDRQENPMKGGVQVMPQMDSEAHPTGVPPGYTYLPTGFVPSGPSGVVYPPYFEADAAMRPIMLNQAPYQPPGYGQREQMPVAETGKFQNNNQRTGNQSSNFNRDSKFQDGNNQPQSSGSPQPQQPTAPIPGQHPYAPYSSPIYAAYPPYMPNQYPSYQTQSQQLAYRYVRPFPNYNSGGYPQQVPGSPGNSQIGNPSFGNQEEMNLNQDYKFPVAPASYFPGADPITMMGKVPQVQPTPGAQPNKNQNFNQGNSSNDLNGTPGAFKNQQHPDFSKGYGNYFIPPFGAQQTNAQGYPGNPVFPPNPNVNPNFANSTNSSTSNTRSQSTQAQGQSQGNTYLTSS